MILKVWIKSSILSSNVRLLRLDHTRPSWIRMASGTAKTLEAANGYTGSIKTLALNIKTKFVASVGAGGSLSSYHCSGTTRSFCRPYDPRERHVTPLLQPRGWILLRSIAEHGNRIGGFRPTLHEAV